jgi:hypothetical protein
VAPRITQEEARPAIGYPDISVRTVIDHLTVLDALAEARIAVAELHEGSRGAVGEEHRLRHAGPARGKVGHPLAAPVRSLG